MISLYRDINIKNPGGTHPLLEVALNRSGIFFWGGGNWQSVLWLGFAFLIVLYVKQKCLGAGSISSGVALLKPRRLVDETEAPSRWEEMTLQEIPYSSRVTKLSGNNEGMSTRRKGMRYRHSLLWPCTCWFLGMK